MATTEETGMGEPSTEKDALAEALCGWHDAESGRSEGEAFPCAACVGQAEYVLTVEGSPIATMQAIAWREGYHHGVDDMTGTETLTVVRRNPYVLPPGEGRA